MAIGGSPDISMEEVVKFSASFAFTVQGFCLWFDRLGDFGSGSAVDKPCGFKFNAVKLSRHTGREGSSGRSPDDRLRLGASIQGQGC
jgi:hypothetical protein